VVKSASSQAKFSQSLFLRREQQGIAKSSFRGMTFL